MYCVLERDIYFYSEVWEACLIEGLSYTFHVRTDKFFDGDNGRVIGLLVADRVWCSRSGHEED